MTHDKWRDEAERMEPKDEIDLACKLHHWYLEATKNLKKESFNQDAQKSFEELTEEQRSIDFYIARKISEALSRAYREGQELHPKERETIFALGLQQGWNSAIEEAKKTVESWGKEMNEPCEYLIKKITDLKR